MKNLIRKISGFFNTAVPFEVVKVRGEHYKALYYDAIAALQNGNNREPLEVNVGKYTLTVIVEMSAKIYSSVGVYDDLGNAERITDSVIHVVVTDHYMIDDNCAGIECDFEKTRFEKMF